MIGTSREVADSIGFVRRQAELDTLSGAMRAARAAKPQIMCIEGEPGIGKTAFIRRFLMTTEDAVVLEASGDESEATLDGGVVLQLFARAASILGETALWEQAARRSPTSAFAVGADLLGMLGALQDGAPVVMVLDDAHWLDSSSAAALLFALRRLYGDRVLVLIVSRPDGLRHLGPSWSRLLADGERARRIMLSGLSGTEVNQPPTRWGSGR